MILIPEIQTVIILPPRTGSGSLRRAVAETYPAAMPIYRHMEADGVPFGYQRWRRIGIAREPLDRLWSLYKFLSRISGDYDQSYISQMKDSARFPFNQWILQNQTIFTGAHDYGNGNRYFPGYAVLHPMPETRKSQFIYLRPDLGTEVFQYEELGGVAQSLGLSLGRHNHTDTTPPPEPNAAVSEHLHRFFNWDLEVTQQAHAR
jgi:hypothetical protein